MSSLRTGGAFSAGAAQVDLTPDVDVHLAVTVGNHWPVKLVSDPIFARALVLEQGSRRICLISTDLLMINRDYSDILRARIAEEIGCAFDAVLLHAVQNHAGPALGNFQITDEYTDLPSEVSWMRGGDERYGPFAVERILAAVALADQRLQPAAVAADSAVEGRLAFNRRMVMRDGSISMPKGGSCDPRFRYVEGPMDPELGVVCLRAANLRPMALLVHYTCHPVHVFKKGLISGDWPGALSSMLTAAYGSQCTSLVLNGACGNINPWDPFDPSYVPDHRRMARILAEGVRRVIDGLRFEEQAILDYGSRHLSIPIRQASPEDVRAARDLLRAHPEPPWTDDEHLSVDKDWQYAHAQLDVERRRESDPFFDYEIQVIRIGSTAIVGLPGEPFVEGGLHIKLDSPTFPTYVAHNTSMAGYIPTREAMLSKGYETRTANWSKFVPEALDMIVDEAGMLLREVFD
jgi:neutral ceramidase